MNESYRVSDLLSQVTQSIVLVYQAIAVLIFIAAVFLGIEWLGKPFIGGIFEHTMVLNGSDTGEPGQHWALYEQGFDIGDQLVSVNGRPIDGARDLGPILDSLQAGQTVPVELRTTEGDVRPTQVTLEPFPFVDRISYFVIPMGLSLVFLGLSLWIFGLRRTESAG